MTAKNVGTTLMDNEERFLYPKTFDKKLNTTTSGGAFSKLSILFNTLAQNMDLYSMKIL